MCCKAVQCWRICNTSQHFTSNEPFSLCHTNKGAAKFNSYLIYFVRISTVFINDLTWCVFMWVFFKVGCCFFFRWLMIAIVFRDCDIILLQWAERCDLLKIRIQYIFWIFPIYYRGLAVHQFRVITLDTLLAYLISGWHATSFENLMQVKIWFLSRGCIIMESIWG